MGKTSKSGLGIGVGSTRQISFIQNDLEVKINEIRRREMLQPLIDAGVKFKSEDVLFVTKDQSGQMVWLEKGDDNSGFNHIKKHANDFENKHKINSDDLEAHILKIVSYGNVEYSTIIKRNNRETIEKLYLYDNEYYSLAGIGTNGYIVTIYPISKEEALKRIKRYKK